MSRFTILMYHMITVPTTIEEAKYACPPERFARHMRSLSHKGYNFVSLNQIEDYLYRDTPLPPKAIAVTLDDGFQDNYTYAFGILKQYKIPAIIFLAVDKIGKTNDWMAKRGFPEHPMLTWEQVFEMKEQGISFGSHTLNHIKLDEADEKTAQVEIEQSKRILESKIASHIKWFAYPYGLYKPETVDILKANSYTLACSTRSGFNRKDIDPLQLRRIEVYGTDSVWRLMQKIKYGSNDAHWAFPLKYYFSRLSNWIQNF